MNMLQRTGVRFALAGILMSTVAFLPHDANAGCWFSNCNTGPSGPSKWPTYPLYDRSIDPTARSIYSSVVKPWNNAPHQHGGRFVSGLKHR